MKKLLQLFCTAILILISSCEPNKDNPSPSAGVLTASQTDASATGALTPISVYGVWHAGNDECTWGAVRNITEFDQKNHWIIDRGDGHPSVNLVILSFVNPLRLLNKTTDAQTLNGVPRGMTKDVVAYFKNKGVRVMLSIGGITYTKDWTTALTKNGVQLGLNAAHIADSLGVGTEIDYEESGKPNLAGLQSFITAYRSLIPYDATGTNHAARLTIDLASGDRWLVGICAKASADWLNTTNPVLDYANAMVPSKQPSASSAQSNWQEHIDGNSRMTPPIPPIVPAKLTGSLWLTSRKAIAECNNFNSSLQKSTGAYVQSVLSKVAGGTPGMLGYMFWAAECEGSRTTCTTPPNSCENGLGAGAAFYNLPIPMQALRQN